MAKLLSHDNSEAINQQIKNLTNQAMEGELDFSIALKKRVSLLNMHQTELKNIISILKERISDSFLENINKIKAISDSVYIISGGFKEIITPIVKDFGIEDNHVFGNQFRYDSKGFINGINNKSLLSYSDGKIRAVETLNLENGAYVIGDGSTDLELKKVKGITSFICFVENINRKSVSSKADYIASNLNQVFEIIDNKK